MMRRALSLIVLILLFFTADFALAGEAGHHHHPSIMDLKWFWINFSLYVFLLYLLLRKKVATGWATRREKLSAEILSAREALEQVQNELSKAKERMARLENDRRDLRRDVESSTENEAKQIVTEAKRRAELIVKQAGVLGVAEKRAARQTLRREVAELVIENARGKLISTLSFEKDKGLRNAAVSASEQLM